MQRASGWSAQRLGGRLLPCGQACTHCSQARASSWTCAAFNRLTPVQPTAAPPPTEAARTPPHPPSLPAAGTHLPQRHPLHFDVRGAQHGRAPEGGGVDLALQKVARLEEAAAKALQVRPRLGQQVVDPQAGRGVGVQGPAARVRARANREERGVRCAMQWACGGRAAADAAEAGAAREQQLALRPARAARTMRAVRCRAGQCARHRPPTRPPLAAGVPAAGAATLNRRQPPGLRTASAAARPMPIRRGGPHPPAPLSAAADAAALHLAGRTPCC